MKNRLVALLLLSVIMLLGSACDLLRQPEAASAPIEAVPLESTAQDDNPSAADTAERSDVSGGLTYKISPADSQVRFELDEDLRGVRTTVVGTTDQIAGEISLDLDQPAAAQIGTILINARTLVTDNNFRNRAIQNRILNTETFEFISFVPNAINGLPSSVAIGDTVSFSLAGDLTIRDFTQPAIFEVTVSVDSQDQLSGAASTTVARADYDLRIPSVPNVANVEDEVELYIDFVARGS